MRASWYWDELQRQLIHQGERDPSDTRRLQTPRQLPTLRTEVRITGRLEPISREEKPITLRGKLQHHLRQAIDDIPIPYCSNISRATIASPNTRQRLGLSTPLKTITAPASKLHHPVEQHQNRNSCRPKTKLAILQEQSTEQDEERDDTIVKQTKKRVTWEKEGASDAGTRAVRLPELISDLALFEGRGREEREFL
ncbi:hypothetical protein Bca52824_052396 [Brassica carinata]|uniref:Uncharacterized protein n=1 Tax=Brassica carinata TaxID=52824 RepID=A0A8X7UKR6_BRACI|nr:hypothetical protein Bca52824_052396 [Brassica carinata]